MNVCMNKVGFIQIVWPRWPGGGIQRRGNDGGNQRGGFEWVEAHPHVDSEVVQNDRTLGGMQVCTVSLDEKFRR